MTAPTRAGLPVVHIKCGSLFQKLPGDGIGAAYARKHRQDRDSIPNSGQLLPFWRLLQIVPSLFCSWLMPNLQEREGSSRRVVKIELWLRSVASRGTVDSGSLTSKSPQTRSTPEERRILDFMCAYQRLRVLLGVSRAFPPGRDCIIMVHIKRGSFLQKLPGDGIGAAYARKVEIHYVGIWISSEKSKSGRGIRVHMFP